MWALLESSTDPYREFSMHISLLSILRGPVVKNLTLFIQVLPKRLPTETLFLFTELFYLPFTHQCSMEYSFKKEHLK